MKDHQKGFTLVEVLIVVVIIAILASLALPRIVSQLERAKMAEAFMMAGVIKRAMENYYNISNTYDPDGTNPTYMESLIGQAPIGNWEALGIRAPNLKNFHVWLRGFGSTYFEFNVATTGMPGDNHVEYISPNNATGAAHRWQCGGPYLKNMVDGDLTTPCVLK